MSPPDIYSNTKYNVPSFSLKSSYKDTIFLWCFIYLKLLSSTIDLASDHEDY